MIITLTGANFSGEIGVANIGTISSLGQPYNVTVTCSTAGATITIKASGMTTVTSTSGSATMSNIPYGTVATYTVSASGYTTKTGTATSTRTIPVTLTAVGGGGTVEPEQPGTGGETPSVPTTTTWYVDHRNNAAKFTASVNKAGRGWCHEINSPAYNAYVGKPVNTVAFFTKLASQEVTVMVGTTNSTPEQCRLIGTFTATNANGSAKGLASITFPVVTLNQGEHLILFAQDSDAIDFYYATAAVNDENGLTDTGFHGRAPKVYGTGTAWQKMSASGTYSLGWSIGYVI